MKAVAVEAQLLDRRKVERTRQGGSVTVSGGTEEFSSKTLIGADGVNNTMHWHVDLEVHHQRSEMIVSIVLEDVMSESEVNLFPYNRDSSHFDINFFTFFPRHAWILSKQGKVNVGIGAVMGKVKGMGKDLEHFLEKKGFDFLDRKKGTVFLIPFRLLSCMRSGKVMQVGTTNGLANPFMGDGKDIGIESEEVASKVGAGALRSNDIDILHLCNDGMVSMARSLQNRLVGLAVDPIERELDSPAENRVVLKTVQQVA